MLKQPVIIGTRGSELALWQARHVSELLLQIGIKSELKVIVTSGDQIANLSFDKMEGKGFFTKEIEDALLKKEIDIAVHSHKDLETTQPDGLCIAAVGKRANANELLLIRKECSDNNLHWNLKANAITGTSSSRRKAQLLHYRPDLILADLRGNVPTRIKKLRDREYDAIVIAKAGVDRISPDISDFIQIVMPVDELVPAAAQGALAIECRTEDQELRFELQKLNNPGTSQVVGIERKILQLMDGGCQLPFGIYVEKNGNEFEIFVASAKTWEGPVQFFTFIADSNEEDELIEMIMRQLK